jgi:uncharacterized protein DUF4232
MRHSSLLFIAFSVTVLGACSPSEPNTAAAKTPDNTVQQSASAVTPAASPIPAGSPNPSQLAVPPPTVPFLRCDSADLEMRLINESAAAGNIGATIEVRNKSKRDCDLYGYAGMQLLDASGRPLPTKVIWSTNSFFLASPAPELVVGLPAATPPITPDRPVPGHAYIPISWNDVLEPCSVASLLRVTPPDAYTSLLISVAPPGGLPSMLEVCSGGTLYVNPTRPAQSP